MHLDGLQQELVQMRVQLDGLQLQVQPVAEKSGDNHVSTTTLDHMATVRVCAAAYTWQHSNDVRQAGGWQ